MIAPIRTYLSILDILRQHPLMGYFLLAFAFTWGWQIPIFGIVRQQLLGPWVIFSPTLAGIIMAGITEGKTGIIRLLHRLLIWKVNLRWYGIALLLMPAVWLGSILMMPGAPSAFQLPDASFLLTYLSAFAYAFMYSLADEEFGWRGFALPRLQKSRGPFWGTLILGLFWGIWHLPGWAFFPSAVGAPAAPLAFAIAFLLYVAMTTASAILYTWVFNHTRGSLLLAVLIHASANASGIAFLSLFPALFPHPAIPVALEFGIIITAAVVIVATRGHLGYEQYRNGLR